MNRYCVGCIKGDTVMKKFLAILLALLVGAAAAVGGMYYLNMKNQPKVDAKGLLERLEESSELTVAKNYYTGIVRFSEGTIPLINKNGFTMKYEAEIDAGFELENVTIEVTDETVNVNVPSAEILSVNVDPDSLEFYDNKTSLIKTDRKEATKQALVAAKADAEEHASAKGLLDEANKRAEVIFKGILADGVGNREIIVTVGASPADQASAEPQEEAQDNTADSTETETEEPANEG